MNAEARYNQVQVKLNIQGKRLQRMFLSGDIDFFPSRDERSAMIRELDRAYQDGLRDGRAEGPRR